MFGDDKIVLHTTVKCNTYWIYRVFRLIYENSIITAENVGE